MRFFCACGYSIHDTSDSLPYKARFIPDEVIYAVYEDACERLEAFITARETGKQDEFLTALYGETYPKNQDMKGILDDLLFSSFYFASRSIYECENCGRMHFEKSPKDNMLLSYVPEGESRGVLQSSRKRPSEKSS